MKNNFKRIIGSIVNHKKDSLLIFGLVFILASFVMIYWLFYFSCSSLVSSINDKASISASLHEDSLNGQEEEALREILLENRISLNDNIFDSYKDYYYKTLDNMLALNNDDKVISSSVLIKGNFRIYQNNDSALRYDVIGFDEDTFNKEGFTLTKGNFISKHNEIMVSEDFFIVDGDNNNYLDVGSYVYIKNANDEVREYEVVGLYKKETDSNSFNEDVLYSSQEIMMDNYEIIDFAYTDDCLGISNILLKVRGYDYSNKLINELKRTLNVIKIGDDNNYLYPLFNAEINNTMASELISPVKSMKNLFQIIAVIMIVIMMLLLCNFMFYIVNKRRKELAIFMALGQSRIEVIRSFLLEVIIIFTIAFILASPFAYLVGKNISGDMLRSNLDMQNRIANISLSEQSLEISSISQDVISEYNLSLNLLDYLLVYLSSGLLIVISSSLAINALCKIRLKELLK